MNRRNFLKTSAALTVCSTVLNTEARARSLLATDPANTWDRPIHIVYAQSGGPSLAETDDVLLNAWDQVPGGITAMTPFLLNVKNPSKYASMINEVQARGITITPGIGQDPSNGPINQPNYKAMAAAYRQYTDYVRLENMQGFYDTYGRAPIQDMIDYCTATLGFTRIMLNPWPKASSGALVPFTNPELDSSFNNVMLDFNRQTFEVNPNPNDWLVNQTYVGLIQAYKPSINVVVNYESAPQHEALLQLEKDNPGSSIPALNITATQCETSPNNLHWCPPFTQIYDPIALGTWPWIANRLGDMPGSVNLQIAMALTRTSTGYEERLTVTNNGTATAADVLVNTATVGSTAGATLPVLLGDLQPNQAASVTLDFPDSAGAPNTRTTGQIAGTYNGGTFGGTLRMILPS